MAKAKKDTDTLRNKLNTATMMLREQIKTNNSELQNNIDLANEQIGQQRVETERDFEKF